MQESDRIPSADDQINSAKHKKYLYIIRTIIALLLAFTGICYNYFITVNSNVFVIIGISQIIIMYIASFREANKGLISVFNGMPRSSAFVSYGLIFCLVHNIYIYFNNEAKLISYAWVLYISIAFSAFFKSLFESEIEKNILMLKKSEIYSVETVSSNISRHTIPNIGIVEELDELPDLTHIIRDGHPNGEKNRVFVPLCLVITVIISIIAGLLYGGEMFFISSSVIFSITAAFMSEGCITLPYLTMQNYLRRIGSVLTGFDSVPRLHDCDTFILYDTDIFTSDCVSVTDLQFRQKKDASFALEYITAALLAAKAPVAKSFKKMIGYNLSLMPDVRNLKYIQNNGISCTINKDFVLIGNRNLMLSSNVAPLPIEKEAIIKSMNLEVLYLAVNGKLSTVVMLKYSANPRLEKVISKIHNNFNIVVETHDCNVTESMINKIYHFGKIRVMVPDEDEQRFIDNTRRKLKRMKPDPVMIVSRNATGLLSSIQHANKLFSLINLSVHTVQTGIIIGIILTSIVTFFLPDLLNPLWSVAYNLIWAIPTLCISFVNRKITEL